MPKSHIPRSCGVVIVYGEPVQSFLLMRHADRWDLPKGHVDPGETDLECALREMEEETGIPRSAVLVDPDFHFEEQYLVSANRYGGKKDDTVLKTLVLFLVRVDQEHALTVTEHQGGRWFPWSPPHQIQSKTIDPVLRQIEFHLISGRPNLPDSA